jgi:hypothetical protein
VKGNRHIIAALLILTPGVGCKDEPGEFAEMSPATQPTAAHAATGQHTGTVVEFINAGIYTYVRVNTGDNRIWAAAPAFQVKVGDTVVIPQGSPMRNFHSKTLDRTFELVYFVGSITTVGSEPAGTKLPKGHPQLPVRDTASPAGAKLDFSGIAKPEGGKTIAEIYNEKTTLSGKKILRYRC